MNTLNENNLTEQSLIEWFKNQGYDYLYGPDVNPGQPNALREGFREVVLKDKLLGAIRRINPTLPTEQAERITKEVSDYSNEDLMLGNKEFYSWITNGKKTSWRENGEEKTDFVKLIDLNNAEQNEFTIINQYTVQGINNVCRFDAVIFINGLPVGLFELKSPIREQASIGEAYRDIEYYKKEIPKIFLFNQVICISDLNLAKHGTVSSSWERYGTWKGIEKENDSEGKTELEVLSCGLFNKERFLDIIKNFIVFEADSDGDAVTYAKKMALYHQYYGVNKTIENTIKSVTGNDKKIGVFWHTQGSGKSLSMVFYINKTKTISELRSPAYVFLTDREDLDTQLYGLFKRVGYNELAKQADSILDLRKHILELNTGASRLIFSTIHKFKDYDDELGEFSERENIIVLADEAHRTQYSMLAGKVRKALPKASFFGVTGTPISNKDKDTERVFGPVISSYKISQAVKDGATVPIFYEGRLIPLHLADKFIDSKFDDLLGEIIPDEKAKLHKEWAVLEEVVGSPDRIKQISKDIVNHYKLRPIEGKAMIVTMSRRIAVAVYKEIRKIEGAPECAVVISGGDEFAGEIQQERNVKVLEKRFKKTNDPLKIAIVCDMWLTGFDVPNLHTMYLDKPLKNHGLMQAIARVNRVYKDKPGGLIVDYIGIAENLKKALSVYDSDVQKNALIPLDEIILEMKKLYDKASQFFGNVPFYDWKKKKGIELVQLFQVGINEVISLNGILSDDRKMIYIGTISKLSKLHALIMPGEEAMKIANDIQFFQAIKGAINKQTVLPYTIFPEEKESAIRDLVQDSIEAEGVIDLFLNENGSKNVVSIFDEKFEEEIKKSKFQNLTIEVIRKLLNKEIIGRMRVNKSRYETMLTLLTELIEKYENNVINSSEIIKNLLQIAEDIKKLDKESQDLGLSSEETVFYDTLQSDPDLKKAGIEIKEFVKELIKRVRRDLTIDWMNNENIKARVKQNVRLLLLQKGIVEQIQTERLVQSIYMETVRVYGDYSPI